MKVRFIEPGNRPYKPTPLNYFVYDRYIRTPSVGLNTLATIVKRRVEDTLMYSESISRIPVKDLLDADVIFIGVFTFAAVRGYQIARYLKKHSKAVIVLGGLHASMKNAWEYTKRNGVGYARTPMRMADMAVLRGGALAMAAAA